MQLCKSFYHHKTNRGGAQGNKGAVSRGKHVLPLARWGKRRLMWQFGLADKFFEDLEHARATGKKEPHANVVAEEDEVPPPQYTEEETNNPFFL